MKKSKRQHNPQQKVLKELATHFEQDLQKSLPISIQPDGTIVYKTYYVKKTKLGNWAVFNLHSKDYVNEFYLRSTALMAAKALHNIQVHKYNEIKLLDSQYWANYMETQVTSFNMKRTKDFERYLILLNKFENSQRLEQFYKDKITTMFRWGFA